MLVSGGGVSRSLMPDVRQQWHGHLVGNILAEVLGKVVRKPHDCLVAMAVTVHLLGLSTKIPCEVEELLPPIAMSILISAHGASVVSILVELIKLWGLEEHHDQLEALQLLSGPFGALLHVAVLLDDGVQLVGHGLEVVSLVRGTRHLRAST